MVKLARKFEKAKEKEGGRGGEGQEVRYDRRGSRLPPYSAPSDVERQSAMSRTKNRRHSFRGGSGGRSTDACWVETYQIFCFLIELEPTPLISHNCAAKHLRALHRSASTCAGCRIMTMRASHGQPPQRNHASMQRAQSQIVRSGQAGHQRSLCRRL